MEPSDFRYDPYNDIPTGIEITERHVIPANSPYHIRLNEVPQKESPSTITVKEITDIAESVTYGQTFSEVAANPAAGEFWPDCNTGANGDENWNTGLITFNAADAGKIIEVSYTGTGTLAGVNSNHWPSWYTDRGDGSDGDFVPTGNTTISGVKNYKSVFIKKGITITIDKYVLIKCLGAFVNNGTITSVGTGYSGGIGAYGNNGDIKRNSSAGCDGYVSGGAGGNGLSSSGSAGGGVSVYGASIPLATLKTMTINYPIYFAGAGGGGGGSYAISNSTGGTGGNGGGCIIVVCNSFNNTNISSNGGNGSSGVSDNAGGGGGGGGGAVIVICKTLNKQGNLTAAGGTGGSHTGNGKDGAVGSNGFTYIKELGAF